MPSTTPCRRDSGWRTRGSAPADSCSFCGTPWLIRSVLSLLSQGCGLPTDTGSVLAGLAAKPAAASRLPSVAEVVTRWMVVPLRVRKRGKPAARVFKNSHEDASLRATGHSRTPTFSACLLKSDNGPSHFKNPIHEPPSAIDVEGEPRPVLPSRTPRKRFIYGHELP